jgi:hypothetical protein
VSSQAAGMGQLEHKYAPADWRDLSPQGLAWQQRRTVAAVDGRRWWQSTSDGGGRGDVGQRQRTAADGGAKAAVMAANDRGGIINPLLEPPTALC